MDTEAAVEKAQQGAVAVKEGALAAFEKAKAEGFFSHFNQFHEEILKPLQRAGDVTVDSVKAELIGTLTFAPPNPAANFVFYNVMALLVGLSESLFVGLILGGGFLSLVWNGVAGYSAAYTLYWVMTAYTDPKAMQFCLAFLVLYCAFTIYMTLHTLLYVLPAILYAIKAFCNLQCLVSGYYLFKNAGGTLPTISSSGVSMQ